MKTYFLKERDLPRIQNKELVFVDEKNFFLPFAQEITTATGIPLLAHKSHTERGSIRTKIFGDYTQQYNRPCELYSTDAAHALTFNERTYMVSWRMFDKDTPSLRVFSYPNSVESFNDFAIFGLSFFDRVYSKYMIFEQFFDESFISMPCGFSPTFVPLQPLILKPVIKDMIQHEMINAKNLHDVLQRAGLSSPKLDHALASLKGMQTYTQTCLEQAVQSL